MLSGFAKYFLIKTDFRRRKNEKIVSIFESSCAGHRRFDLGGDISVSFESLKLEQLPLPFYLRPCLIRKN